MESLKGASVSHIAAVPGLFISDYFAARSISLLKSHNIAYVLSVTRREHVPKFNTLAFPEAEKMKQKHIDIDDDPTEDILCHLKDACDWIEAGLQSGSRKDDDCDKHKQVGVLVHCTQGISRSGSIVVAYLMRRFSLPCSSALALARESRLLISPNTGFERQLRVWEQCKYEIYLEGSASVSPKEKAAYKIWKSQRDRLVSQGEEAVKQARFSSMASMAAEFGRRRLEKNAKIMNEGVHSEGDRVDSEKIKEES